MDKTWSDGFISKKDQLKGKGKFEVGSKDVKVSIRRGVINLQATS